MRVLQTLGESICDITKQSQNDRQGPDLSDGGVFLFFSFDLAESTVFKAEHPSLWASVFTCFYSQVLEGLGVEDYKSPDDGDDDSACVRKLWKLIGDEILIYVRILHPGQLYTQITSVSKALSSMTERIADKVEEALVEGTCPVRHCRDVREVILSVLGIKATAWLAQCHDGEAANVPNIIYYPTTATGEKRIDFLGKEIDEGFRIAEYAVKNKMILSPLLAWMIWKDAQGDKDRENIVKANFRITAFARMKGVWRGRKVPVVMFHQPFDEFGHVLEYDETDLETYANVREAGLGNFLKDSRFEIGSIDDILRNVHKDTEAEKLYRNLKEIPDMEVISEHIEKKQEFHVACMIFDREGRILVHKDPERGYEFGCLKRILGAGARDWQGACVEGYREKYQIEIDVPQCPVPVATYYYGKSNAFGLLVLADYKGRTEDVKGRPDWELYSPQVLMEGEEKAVDQFRENIRRAMVLRKGQDEE